MTGSSARRVLKPPMLLHFGLKPTWPKGWDENQSRAEWGAAVLTLFPLISLAREFIWLTGRGERGDLKWRVNQILIFLKAGQKKRLERYVKHPKMRRP